MNEANLETVKDLNYFVNSLKSMTHKLNNLSTLILLFLTVSMACFAFALSVLKVRAFYLVVLRYLQWFYFASFVACLFGILSLIVFNRIRNHGMICYEELTDELEWGKDRQDYKERPPIDYRITIKKFLKATDLPLTYSPNGQIFYFAFFLILLLANIIFVGLGLY
jgi:hypothetical protein